MFGVWINMVLLYINIELNNKMEKGMAANIKNTTGKTTGTLIRGLNIVKKKVT